MMISMPIKRIISAILLSLIMALVFFEMPSVSAIDYEAEIAKIEAELERLKERQENRDKLIKEYKDDVSKQDELYQIVEDKINEIDAKIELQNSLITAKQHEIDQKLANLDHLDAQIIDTEQTIADTNDLIAQLEHENAVNLESFGQIVKMLYMTDNIDPVSQLMGATDFFDLLVRTEMLKNIGESNKKFMNDLLSSIEEQNQLIAQLQANIEKLENEKLRAEEEKLALEAEEADLLVIKAGLDREIEAERAELWDITANMQSLRSKINSAERLQSENQELQEQANKEMARLTREWHRANSGQTVYSSDEFLWPLESKFKNLTTYFGYDAWRGGNHYGIDVDGTGAGGIGGASVYAAQSGTVMASYNDGGWHGGYGNYILIDHGDSISTLYAHCQTGTVVVSKGQTVERGDLIGRVGATGWATGNHLHFEVRLDGVAVNPLGYKYENRDY